MYVIPHFLSPRELDHLDGLITSHRKAFKHSHTDGAEGSLLSEERTSVSLPLPKSGDSVLRAIESRAADIVNLPADFVEPLQVVHYSHGAKFDMHHDLAPIKVHGESEQGPQADSSGNSADGRRKGASADNEPSSPSTTDHWTIDDVSVEDNAGPRRLITLFVYLNTLPEGVGHTEFPLLRRPDGTAFSVRPRSGTALLFCNVDAGGKPDVRLCHRACPVDDDHVKFGMNIWVSDVSQQAHAVAALGRAPGKAAASAAKNGKGLLAPLLLTESADHPPPPPLAIVGLEIRKRFGRHGWFTGRVVSHSPVNGYCVVYCDGDEEHVSVDELSALPLANPEALVGRRVAKHFPGYGRFEGSVVGYDKGRSEFGVDYEDGDHEDLCREEVLRLLLPGKPPSRKRRRPRADGGGH